MKKLLQWFAPVPFIVIAFGWGHSVASPDKMVDTTTYYYGGGVADSARVESGGHNNEYRLIGVDLEIDSDKNINYQISESVNHLVVTAENDLTLTAKAEPVWNVSSDDTDEGRIIGSSLIANGWEETATGGAKIIPTDYYTNSGEKLEYVYDVVPVTFDKYQDNLFDSEGDKVDYEAKDALNTGSEWALEMAMIQEYLTVNYGTCTEVNLMDENDLANMAHVKNVSNATPSDLIEAELYVGAAIHAAQEAC